MSQLPCPSDPWRAGLALHFAKRNQRTVLSCKRHHGPLRLQKALYPEAAAVCHGVILHPPGGIVGGDQLTIELCLDEGAQALLTTPGAGKWYRSNGQTAAQTVTARVGKAGGLEWLPQETIVFDGAKLYTRHHVDLADDAVYIGWEVLCLGRTASAERFNHGHCNLGYTLDRAGKALWREHGQWSGGDRLLTSPAGWAGASVAATLVAVSPRPIDRQCLDDCRRIAVTDGGRVGITALANGLTLARYLGDSSEAAKHWLIALWEQVRPSLLGRVAQPPRIWST